MNDQILLYKTPDGQIGIDVRLEDETVWLSLNQMASLFGRDKSVISRHLGNIFKEKELSKKAVVAKFATTAADRKTYQVEYFNLDAIISVGYRVNSKRGTQFRQWATTTLKQHLITGFTTNSKRLAEQGLGEMQQALELLSRTLNNQALINDTGRDVLSLIIGYAKTWRLLLQYDEDRLQLPKQPKPTHSVLPYKEIKTAITIFKQELQTRGEASALFGQEREEALYSILRNLEQTFGGKPLYPSREEKAAHLLYFIIKDHPFTDGNKRIGSFLFLLFLQTQHIPYRINDNTLLALALLLAESEPKNKNLMIRLIVNLLME
jgi:prophage maintenance system killer protein